jgi:hypothetical protein
METKADFASFYASLITFFGIKKKREKYQDKTRQSDRRSDPNRPDQIRQDQTRPDKDRQDFFSA